MIQKPEASMVAGFRQWQSLGRNVIKGATALRVLAPMVVRAKVDRDTRRGAESSAVEAPQSDPSDKPSTSDRRELGIRGYKAVPVFDVSQTEGEPLPEPTRPVLLQGEAPEGLWDALAEQVTAAGFTLERAESAEQIYGANGITKFVDRVVSVRADVSDAQAVRTLAHELAHTRLHDPVDGEVFRCRGEAEVEAESVAYLVSAESGLVTDDYTFAYVARWVETAKADVLARTAERIRSTARTILDTIDMPNPVPASEAVRPAVMVGPWVAAEPFSEPLSATPLVAVSL